jgi:hypothetical protein
MRKRIRILLLASLVAAIVVPVGFALSLPSSQRAVSATHGVVPIAQITQIGVSGAPLVASTSAAVTALPPVPEGAKLLVIGTALFGLAAVMKRTNL